MVIGVIVGLFLVLVAAFMFFAKDDMFAGAASLLVVGLIITGVSLSAGSAYYNERTLECTIVDKDRGYNASTKSNEYRVYTEQCGTFLNQDSIFRGKFNSGDVQGQLQVGETYELVVAGPRIGLFSMFPNIFEVRPVGN